MNNRIYKLREQSLNAVNKISAREGSFDNRIL